MASQSLGFASLGFSTSGLEPGLGSLLSASGLGLGLSAGTPSGTQLWLLVYGFGLLLAPRVFASKWRLSAAIYGLLPCLGLEAASQGQDARFVSGVFVGNETVSQVL